MVGEIRDDETAQIAANAALTGNLVLATLHSITSAGAIFRLREMQVKPEILSQSLNCILNQRLLKVLCQNCKTVSGEKNNFGIKSYISKGCKECNGTGFKGRIPVYEILYVTDEAKDQIRKEKPENLDVFIKKPLWEQGIKLVENGVISFNEFIENVRIPSNVEENLKTKKYKLLKKEFAFI